MDESELLGFLETEDGKLAYAEWLKNPVTKRMRDASLRMSRPSGLAKPNAEGALYYLGISVGYHLVASCIFEADKLAESRTKAGESLEEDFGLQEIMEEFGYGQSSR